MSLPPAPEWLNALEIEFHQLATGMLGLTAGEVLKRHDSPPPDMEGAYLGFVSDEGAYQIGLAASRDGCQALARGLLSVEAGAPLLPAADVADAVCEIVNMLAGCVQRRLRDKHASELRLGLPTFFHGAAQPTERLAIAVAEVRVGECPAALLVLHPRKSGIQGS